MVAQNVVFGILAAVMIISAWKVVTTKNVVRAVLYLVVVLAGAGAQYLLLAQEFIFVVQVIVYIGAIVVLFLFGIMLTRSPMGNSDELDNNQRPVAAVVALFLAGALGALLIDAFRDNKIADPTIARTGDIGADIFQKFVIPFEVVSVLLLAALVGAIAIARRD